MNAETLLSYMKDCLEIRGYQFTEEQLKDLYEVYEECQDWDENDKMVTGCSYDDVEDFVKHSSDVDKILGTEYKDNSIRVISVDEIDKFADTLLESLANGSTTVNGDRVGDYRVIAADTKDNNVSVSLVENTHFDDVAAKPYYTLHLIDNITDADCELYHSADLSKESLVTLLEEVVEDVYMQLNIEKSEPVKNKAKSDYERD